jgi:hypothetical protein
MTWAREVGLHLRVEAAGEAVHSVEQAPAQLRLQKHTSAAAEDPLAWEPQVVPRAPGLG